MHFVTRDLWRPTFGRFILLAAERRKLFRAQSGLFHCAADSEVNSLIILTFVLNENRVLRRCFSVLRHFMK